MPEKCLLCQSSNVNKIENHSLTLKVRIIAPIQTKNEDVQ